MAIGKFGVNLYTGDSKPKKTSQSSRKRSVKMSSMNKSKKRSYKAYNSQGR
jgi:hypothetical protein